uniref:putative uncharacterized protein BRD3OS isoform X3 n=1 Tax=Panthera onca TaxID=9690 RepID=UPI002955DECF|nr:putative uncharacterized protein BRD3OS isoform X3 [Panthera onca]
MLIAIATAVAKVHEKQHETTVNKTLGPTATVAGGDKGRSGSPAPPPPVARSGPAPGASAAPARRAGLPGLGARLGMPAALPWRRGPEANGPRPRLRAPRPRARTSPRPLGAAQGPPRCLEQKEGAGGGHHPGRELRTKH